jgi:hypothetical protein
VVPPRRPALERTPLRHRYLQKREAALNHFALLPNQPVMEANATDAVARSAQEARTCWRQFTKHA